MSSTVITRPEIELAPDVLKALMACTHEEGQVTIHCVSRAALQFDHYIRIWPTTFLLDHHSKHKSELVHVENISLAPTWRTVQAGKTVHYSLIFSGLPKSCLVFDLEEIIPLPGRFTAKNIVRNETDVYYIRL